jgi:hypothetical protein
MIKTIREIGAKEWAEQIIDMILNPSQQIVFKDSQGRNQNIKFGSDLLKELNYTGHEQEFI